MCLAPVVYLYSGDPYYPSDIGSQLAHTKPENGFTPIQGAPNPLTLNNLASLNADGGTSVYLTSVDDVTKNPPWLNGVKPDSSGKTEGAVSATVVVNDHGGGKVDAFYFYFYAYNWGGILPIFEALVDDHVGDWEYTMVSRAYHLRSCLPLNSALC